VLERDPKSKKTIVEEERKKLLDTVPHCVRFRTDEILINHARENRAETPKLIFRSRLPVLWISPSPLPKSPRRPKERKRTCFTYNNSHSRLWYTIRYIKYVLELKVCCSTVKNGSNGFWCVLKTRKWLNLIDLDTGCIHSHQ